MCLWEFSDQARHKPVCAATEASLSLEISAIDSRDTVLSKQRTTNVLIRLSGCASWSAPLLFTYDIRHIFSWLGSYLFTSVVLIPKSTQDYKLEFYFFFLPFSPLHIVKSIFVEEHIVHTDQVCLKYVYRYSVFYDLLIFDISWYKKSRRTTRPTKWLCAQQRLRSASASAQSDQSLRYPHEEALGPWLSIERTAKTRIRLGGCPGWCESSLGAQSFCWSCRDVAHITVTCNDYKVAVQCDRFRKVLTLVYNISTSDSLVIVLTIIIPFQNYFILMGTIGLNICTSV